MDTKCESKRLIYSTFQLCPIQMYLDSTYVMMQKISYCITLFNYKSLFNTDLTQCLVLLDAWLELEKCVTFH